MRTRLFVLSLFLLHTALSCYAQELLILPSKHLGCNDTVRIYSPEKQNNKPTPTLFLLHGWSGNYRNWGDKYNLQELCNKTGFRIITPDGFYNSWYLNNINPSQMQWSSFFHEELYPFIREKYGLDPQTTFISGLSMGGHGAINLFMDAPDLFRSAGSMSGVLDLQLTSLRNTELAKVIGTEEEQVKAASAVNRIEKLSGLNKPIIISCGYDDVYVKCSEVFSAKCREKGIPHCLLLTPGKHSWTYWSYALEEHLAFFIRLLQQENMGY